MYNRVCNVICCAVLLVCITFAQYRCDGPLKAADRPAPSSYSCYCECLWLLQVHAVGTLLLAELLLAKVASCCCPPSLLFYLLSSLC